MLRAGLDSYIYPILYEVQQAMVSIKDWFWKFLNSVFNNNGALHELQPLFVIGIAVSAVLLGIFIIKKVVWGR